MGHTDDPFGLPNDPFGLPDDPFGLPNDPFGLPNDPFGLPDDPFGLPDDPFGLPCDSFARTGDPVTRIAVLFARMARACQEIAKPEDVYVGHGETIVAEADLAIGSLALGADEGAQIVVPPELCPVNFARVELSVDGSVHVATLTGVPTFDAARFGAPRRRLDHGAFVRASGFAVTRLCFAERSAAGSHKRRVDAFPTVGSPEIAAPSGPPTSLEVESHGRNRHDDPGIGHGSTIDGRWLHASAAAAPSSSLSPPQEFAYGRQTFSRRPPAVIVTHRVGA